MSEVDHESEKDFGEVLAEHWKGKKPVVVQPNEAWIISMMLSACYHRGILSNTVFSGLMKTLGYEDDAEFSIRAKQHLDLERKKK